MGDPSQGLWAISSLDGRYREKLAELALDVSEGALIRYRLRVEAAWLLHLSEASELKGSLTLTSAVKNDLRSLISEEVPADVQQAVKDIEKETNHDVKAVEYYLRGRLKKLGADDAVLSFIHFACTSEDINNLAYCMMLDDVRSKHLFPAMDYVIDEIYAQVGEYAALPMLARTHGQSASPTTLGKEMAVFGRRLQKQKQILGKIKLEAKMNGAVGNYNAHLTAYPKVDWPKLTKNFIEERLKFTQNPLTTQIEPHDSMIEYIDCVRRFNTILLGLCRDMWSYISLGYFKQFMKEKEVGSSTMPHKVNPIDFENAEGNLGVSITLAQHFAEKLPVSRWQRDLSDSSVLRVLGAFFGHSVLSYNSCLKGLSKVSAAKEVMAADLNDAWEVLAEPVQTVMRRYGIVDAYERLKSATRGAKVNKELFHKIIDSSTEIPAADRKRLKELTPETYTGLAERLAREFAKSQG